MAKKTPSKRSKRKSKQLYTEKTILEMISFLDQGDIPKVKKFLLSLIPPKPKAKKTIQEVASIFRQDLAKNATNEELITRDILKANSISHKFQHVVFVNKSKFYIVDFYIPKLKLAIELDGFHHHTPEQQEKDLQRTEALNVKGISVVRFDNCETRNRRKFQQKLLETIKKFENNLHI